MSRFASAALVALVACGSDAVDAPLVPPSETPSPPSEQAKPSGEDASSVAPPADEPAPPLRVRYLGVAGFLIERGDESVLTAPLFTRPTMIEASTGLPVSADAAFVEQKLPTPVLANVRAILSGHAHYDHLLDVPAVMQRASTATLYANRSARNLLAAYAPDRAAACDGTPSASPAIARSRVVALDDALASKVDWRSCPSKKPPGVPLEGTWVNVPGSNIRVLAVCSEHPDQIGPIHFGAGDVTEEQCTPPRRMDAWKEGTTLAFLVDFLDPKTGSPTYRVYYQDAPTNAPAGHVPDAILGEKRIDLALLCVGSYQAVEDAPSQTLAAMKPRFAIGGHWEDFFRHADEAPAPITFLDVSAWKTKALAELPVAAEAHAWSYNGKTGDARAILPQPGDTFQIVP